MTKRMPAWSVIATLAAATLVACGGDDTSSTTLGSMTTLPVAPSSPTTALPSPTTASVESELAVFAKVAPADKVLDDANIYDTKRGGSIALSAINEDASVKRHTITINGKVLPYVARAGHLIAYHGNGTARKAEAAIFYTAYTRDALPKENRPVTFLWNGGPGSASIWLHMGSWGPKRLKSDAPNMADPTKQPDGFPFEDNAISLLDQSDIVFVDPPGTGLSTAIGPFKNGDLWGTDIDAQVVADFITSYTNKYNRQSSPKYLYGESYGGIRTPIVANLLEQAGTSGYASDPSGKPAKVLAGFILNSPLVDYNSNCEMTGGKGTCEGYIPSYAMTADYFKKSVKRAGQTQEQYLNELRALAKTTFQATFKTYFNSNGKPNGKWNAYAASPAGQAILNRIADYTGIPASTWSSSFNYTPGPFRGTLVSGYNLGRYDARMKVPNGNSFEADDYINVAFLNELKTYFPDFVNYKTRSSYEPLNNATIRNWTWQRAGSKSSNPQSITDIQAVLTANPDAKLLILHGYEDLATPGFQTELDLEGVNLADRIPIKWFEGGHMIYNTEMSRVPLKQAIDNYYQSPARIADGSLL
ncbi:peptidase [Burkholderia cepacia]|uniref:Peptidase n=1 Tax=Burkholderia cepacia TaxID=292 RepID=A0A0J5XB03_BURCE|nr:peptidase [Burkholderia cepacia]KML61811.1 peptidase [Burkholderia cepacia]